MVTFDRRHGAAKLMSEGCRSFDMTFFGPSEYLCALLVNIFLPALWMCCTLMGNRCRLLVDSSSETDGVPAVGVPSVSPSPFQWQPPATFAVCMSPLHRSRR